MPVDVQQVLRAGHRACRPIEADLHNASFFACRANCQFALYPVCLSDHFTVVNVVRVAYTPEPALAGFPDMPGAGFNRCFFSVMIRIPGGLFFTAAYGCSLSAVSGFFCV
jgi:hypothetical protein